VTTACQPEVLPKLSSISNSSGFIRTNHLNHLFLVGYGLSALLPAAMALSALLMSVNLLALPIL